MANYLLPIDAVKTGLEIITTNITRLDDMEVAHSFKKKIKLL